MSKPTAVIISDIHFQPATLEVATSALKAAQLEAIRLGVPLVIAGDTLDSKAIMRGECVNRLIEILDVSRPVTYIMVGNHDLINEKSSEHTLNFLRPYCHVVSSPVKIPQIDAWLVPYFSDPAKLQDFLKHCNTGSTLIMHQGVQTADMGHYVQDKTSLPPSAFARFRVISGHYHTAQEIFCTETAGLEPIGMFSYIGNPYTLNFGEAEQGPKGFRVLHDDGSLSFVNTNLRRHRKVAWRHDDDEDLLLDIGIIKAVSKVEYAHRLGLPHANFKLELCPTDSAPVPTDHRTKTGQELLDALIDALGDTPEHKAALKEIWRDLCES